MTTIGALFQSSAEAEQVIDSLEAIGVEPEKTRILVDADAMGRCLDENKFGSVNWKLVGIAILLGAVVFGLVGFFAAVDNLRYGLTAIPQSLFTTFVFAAIGAFVGAFLGIFMGYRDCECDTRQYVEGVRRGGVVVVVRAEGPLTNTIYHVLRKNNGAYPKLCGQPGGGH